MVVDRRIMSLCVNQFSCDLNEGTCAARNLSSAMRISILLEYLITDRSSGKIKISTFAISESEIEYLKVSRISIIGAKQEVAVILKIVKSRSTLKLFERKIKNL